jgi:hypothetical protein
LELVAFCDLWPQRRLTLQATLAPGMVQELPSLKFTPQTAGAEVIHLEATLKAPDGLPLGRWVAAKDLIVEDAAGTATGPITAEKGSTIIVSTGPPALPGLPSAPATWQPIPLQPEAAFHLRLKDACPAAAEMPPAGLDAGRFWPAANPLHGALHIENTHDGHKFSLAVVCALSASFGRGGDPSVSWWLLPAPYDETQHRRLSRRHVSLVLSAGRAWVSDHSANGTRLNRQPLVRDTAELLAQGDRLDPAGVVPLIIAELGTSRGKVHAIWIDRGDGLAGHLRYLLTDASAPVAVHPTPGATAGLWLAWLRGKDASLLPAACVPGASWLGIPPGTTAVIGPYRLSWQPLAGPGEQDQYMRPPGG